MLARREVQEDIEALQAESEVSPRDVEQAGSRDLAYWRRVYGSTAHPKPYTLHPKP